MFNKWKILVKINKHGIIIKSLSVIVSKYYVIINIYFIDYWLATTVDIQLFTCAINKIFGLL